MTQRTAYLAFGRDDQSEDAYGPWWPLFIEDGPHLASSPGEAQRLIEERLAFGGEHNWVEIAVVPVSEWRGGWFVDSGAAA